MNESLQRYERWRAQADLDPAVAAELAAIEGDEAAVTDRFYRDLAFGTAVCAAVLGAGTNRMNIYTVRKATQGLADYLNATALPKKVAIAHDSRHNGDVFARETARVLAANGITACLYPRLEPTPALSWAVRYLGCGAGVCVTGVPQPGQIQRLQGLRRGRLPDHAGSGGKDPAAIEAVDIFDGVRLADYDEAMAAAALLRSATTASTRLWTPSMPSASAARGHRGPQPCLYPAQRFGARVCAQAARQARRHPCDRRARTGKAGRGFPDLPLPQPRDPRSDAERAGAVRQGPPPTCGLAPTPDCDRCGAAVPGRSGRLPADHRQRDGHYPAGLHLPHRLAKAQCPKTPSP